MIAPFYHVGIVVPDLGQARRDLSSSLGLTWSRERHVDMAIVVDGRPVQLKTALVYSVEGPPHVELIVECGPPWNIREGMHHIGVWSEDILADMNALVAEKYTVAATTDNRSDNYVNGFAYMKGPTGLLIELVDSRRMGPLNSWLTGDELE
jgi:catechol 2,3-dioxygenase-like lactoylglutathione lyase family enzyme